MATNAKQAMLKALVAGQVTDLLIKTNAEAVEVAEGVSLATKLTEMATDIATKTTQDQVNTAISTAIDKLIGGAPETYDTLKEIADFIATHGEAAAALTAEVGKKVDKVEGKGLSTNDYTTAEKNKLAGLNNYTHPTTAGNKHIPSGGAAGQILGWQADGTAKWQNEISYVPATTSADGLMSKEDKTKLDGLNGVRVSSEIPADLKQGELLIYLPA